MIILVGGEKGGTGKSCLAQNLAVYFLLETKASVLIADCDPHHSSSDWVQTRNNNPNLITINCIQLSGKIRNDLLSLNQHYDYIFVDCGGKDNLALRATMSVADRVIIPFRPKRRDISTAHAIEDMVSTCKLVNPKMSVHAVLSQCPQSAKQEYRISEAKKSLTASGFSLLEQVTYSRSIVDDCEESGFGVIEVEPGGDAAREISLIANELKLINPNNNKTDYKSYLL